MKIILIIAHVWGGITQIDMTPPRIGHDFDEKLELAYTTCTARAVEINARPASNLDATCVKL